MYPKKDTSLHDETIRRHSNVVIGILIISLTIIFGLSVLGVWGIENTKNGIHDDDDESPLIPENKPTEEKISKQTPPEISSEVVSSEIETSEGESFEISISEDNLSEAVVSMGYSDEPVLEWKCCNGLDTETGSIVITEKNCPVLEDPLPLCITQDDLNDCYMIIEVVGGYEPICGSCCIYQPKTGCGGKIIWNWDLTNPDDPCCVPKVYKVTFTLEDGPICLESNHVPDIEGWCQDPDPGTELDKRVNICCCMKWTGCEEPEQEFLAILAHKSYVPESPTLDERYIVQLMNNNWNAFLARKLAIFFNFKIKTIF